jgi:hypothetical protein
VWVVNGASPRHVLSLGPRPLSCGRAQSTLRVPRAEIPCGQFVVGPWIRHRLHIQARRLTRSHGLFCHLAGRCVVGSRCPSNFRSLLFSTCPPTRLIRSWAPPTSVRHCDFVSFQCLGYTLPHVWSPPTLLSGILHSESYLGTCQTVNCLSDSGSPTPLVVSQFVDISRLSNISAIGSSSTGSGT